jgi:hypothetical protein
MIMSGSTICRRAAVVLPLLAVVPLSDAFATISVSVLPPILDLSVPPGGRRELALTIKNLGSSRVDVQPAVMDVMLEPTGAALPVEPGKGAPSCAAWVSMDQSGFSLAPGQSAVHDVVFEVPRGVAGGRYCVIVFEAREAERSAPGPSLNISTRTGTIIMETASRRSRRGGEIVDIKTGRNGDHEVGIVALFKNTGEIHLKIRPSCLVRNREGRVIDRLSVDAGTGTVLPGGIRQISATWNNGRKMVPGSYRAEVAVDFTGGRRVTESVDFTID